MSTIKQKKTAKLLATNNNMNITEAMVQAGYSPSVRTTQVTKAKGFIEIMEKLGLTDDYIAKQVRAGMKAKLPSKHPDWTNRHKYLETSLKLKGKYEQQGSSNATINIINPLAVQVNEGKEQG